MRYHEPPPARDPVLVKLFERRGVIAYLSDELGVSRQAISKWRSVPESRVPEVSRLLGVPQYQLRRGRRDVSR